MGIYMVGIAAGNAAQRKLQSRRQSTLLWPYREVIESLILRACGNL